MRVLLDEQLPRRLARELVGHDVRTVQQQRWAGLKNATIWLDAHLPPQIAPWMAATFGVDVVPVRDLALRDAEDEAIFAAARAADAVLLTQGPRLPRDGAPNTRNVRATACAASNVAGVHVCGSTVAAQ